MRIRLDGTITLTVEDVEDNNTLPTAEIDISQIVNEIETINEANEERAEADENVNRQEERIERTVMEIQSLKDQITELEEIKVGQEDVLRALHAKRAELQSRRIERTVMEIQSLKNQITELEEIKAGQEVVLRALQDKRSKMPETRSISALMKQLSNAKIRANNSVHNRRKQPVSPRNWDMLYSLERIQDEDLTGRDRVRAYEAFTTAAKDWVPDALDRFCQLRELHKPVEMTVWSEETDENESIRETVTVCKGCYDNAVWRHYPCETRRIIDGEEEK